MSKHIFFALCSSFLNQILLCRQYLSSKHTLFVLGSNKIVTFLTGSGRELAVGWSAFFAACFLFHSCRWYCYCVIVILILLLCECCSKQHQVLGGGKDYHLVWGEIPLGVVHILAGLYLLRRVDAANDFFMSFKFFFDNFQFLTFQRPLCWKSHRWLVPLLSITAPNVSLKPLQNTGRTKNWKICTF